MGRPPMARGTYGEVWVSDKGKPYKARARLRTEDGSYRTMARFGQTKTAARDALREALRDWQRGAAGSVESASKVSAVAHQWLAESIEPDPSKATNTKQLYRYAVERYVIPYFGEMRVQELDTGFCDRALKRITANHGPSAAKTARAVLNGTLGFAVRHGALTINPFREVERIGTNRSLARALTPATEEDLCDKLRSVERAVKWDLPDLVDWMLATGCRIGEALALRDGVNEDGEPLLDLEGGTWEIDATTVRVKGVGMVLQLRPKSKAGRRRIALPPFAVELMRGRREQIRLQPPSVLLLNEDGTRAQSGLWVGFPAPRARALRDPANTQGDLREVLDSLDCEACAGTGYELDAAGGLVLNARGRQVRCRQGQWSWVTSHTFRKTVTTRLLKAGIDPMAVADHMGHSESAMTLNVYGGRKVVSSDAARILDR